MKRQAEAGVHEGWPYSAVGMHRALDSSIGFPSRSTRASRMLVFVTPPDVRRSFKLPPEGVDVGENVLGAYRSVRGRDWQAGENSSVRARSRSCLHETFPNARAARRYDAGSLKLRASSG